MTNNLASPVQVSIDTALQPCEDSKVMWRSTLGSLKGVVDGAVDGPMLGSLTGLADLDVVVNGRRLNTGVFNRAWLVAGHIVTHRGAQCRWLSSMSPTLGPSWAFV